jgi:hypothetical protein
MTSDVHTDLPDEAADKLPRNRRLRGCGRSPAAAAAARTMGQLAASRRERQWVARITPAPLEFQYRLIHKEHGSYTSLSSLSSGERALASLCCWLFNAADNNVLPELLLLDEPDAHLHPSAISRLVEVLKDVLVAQYNMRVIMTTYRPTTVQFVPESSIFEMRREPTLQIVPATRASSIALLTLGFVNVLPATKMVLVEDNDDALFYQTVFEILAFKGDLTPGIPITFIQAGKEKKSNADLSGGRTVVLHWVKKLHDGPLESLLFGLIDLDNNPTSEEGKFQLDRYSIENYWWDPLVIYHCLASQQRAPRIDGNQIPAQCLRDAETETLQKVADTIISTCENALGLKDQARMDIEYCNGVKLSCPEWLLSKNSKKHLAETIGSAFGGNALMNATGLKESFAQLAMIPMSLRDLLRRIQSA